MAINFQVYHVNGSAFKDTENQKKIPIIKKMMIYEGDTIYTSENSFLILKGSDFSVHRIEENSKLLVSQTPTIIENEIDKPAVFEIMHGSIFNEILKKHDAESFQIKSHNVTFGVRGTKFLISRDKELNDVVISVNSGEVEVQNQYTNSTEFIEPSETMLIEKDFNFTQKQKIKDLLDEKDWDLSDLKTKRRDFRQKRKIAYQKLREKREKWKPNKERIEKKREEWKARKNKWEQERRKRKLNSFSGKKEEKKELIDQKIRNRQKSQDIRNDIQDKKQSLEQRRKRVIKRKRQEKRSPSP